MEQSSTAPLQTSFQLEQAEELLTRPGAGTIDEAGRCLRRAIEAIHLHPEPAAVLRAEAGRIARIGLLLESAWRLHLGLYRLTQAGLHGYTSLGKAAETVPRPPLSGGVRA